MMMDCPRCGFNQPKDRFCASCGLDVDQFQAKPTALWLRILQNPNFHLSLIGLLLVVVAGYIFYSRSEMLGREVDDLLRSTPLSSRDSRDTSEEDSTDAPVQAAAFAAGTDAQTADDLAETATLQSVAATETAKVAAAPKVQKIEVGAWEVPRDTLSALIVDAERLIEASEGRAYYWAQGAKVSEALQAAARHLALNRTMASQAQAQAIIETPASAGEGFHFGFMSEVTKADGKHIAIRWQGNWILTPAADNVPIAQASMSGAAAMGPQSLVMIVLEPTTRNVREDLLLRAGEGPWSIFASEDFRSGATDWVILLQPK